MTLHPPRKVGPASIKLLATLAILGPWLGASRAEAQFGFGGYGGYGLGYNPNAYSDVNYLNQRSLVNASNAASGGQNSLSAPRFETRDTSFYDKYDLATRESMIDRVARHPNQEMGTADPSGAVPRPPSRPSTSTTRTAQPPAPPATVHLDNYFTKDQKIVWPSVAPISGDFGKNQALAEQAALAVRNEYELKGLAQLSTVTDARKKLLDYGRPALVYVNEHSTPAMADSFHIFLLALYDNLGNAATVPKSR